MRDERKRAEQTVLHSKNDVGTIRLSPARRPRIEYIRIDMTGWGNGDRGDEAPESPDTHPYTVVFKDGAGVRQEFTTNTMNSRGLTDMMNILYDRFQVTPTISTEVHVVTPRDCIEDGGMANGSPYGRTCRMNIRDLNARGMDCLGYRPTYDGVAGKRLESGLDEICHQFSLRSRAERHMAVRRGARFENSVYRYYDKDNRNADKFQRYLDSLSGDDMAPFMTGVPFGEDPCKDDLEI